MGINTVTIAGSIVHDARHERPNRGVPYVSFALSVQSEPGEHGMSGKHAIYDVCWWGLEAGELAPALMAGQQVVVCGRLMQKALKDKTGRTRIVTRIRASHIVLASARAFRACIGSAHI